MSALDVKLRERMRRELKAIQHAAGTTFVFVTHDQGEALAMSDRIAIMDAGQVVQIGTPEDLYHRPESDFVADFVGAASSFQVILTADGSVRSEGVAISVPGRRGDKVAVRIRPERVRVHTLANPPSTTNRLQGRVRELSFGGEVTAVDVDTPVGLIQSRLPADFGRLAPGDDVVLTWADSDLLTATPVH